MEQSQLQSIWEQILSKMKESLSEVVCDKWLSPVKPLSINKDTFLIGTATEFSKKWIGERYLAMLEDAMFEIMGERFNIKLKNLELPQKEAPFPSMNVSVPNSSSIHGTRQRQKKKIPSSFVQPTLIELPEDEPEEGATIKKSYDSPAYAVHDVYEMIPPGDSSTLNSKYTFDTFVTGKSNQFAHAAALAVAESPGKVYNPFFMYGGVGLGKTHLMHAIGHHILGSFPDKRVLYVSSEQFMNEMINSIRDGLQEEFRQKYRNIDVLLVDDIQFLSKKAGTQEEFFHTFNTLRDAEKQIIISSDKPPKEVEHLEERLRSRFEWGLIADVQPPDFETRIAILKKKAQLENLNVPDDVMIHIANSIDSNIRELEGALTRVVAYSSLTHQPITIELTDNTLKSLFPNSKPKIITLELIENVVSDYYGISVNELHTKNRSRNIAYPRQIAMYLSRELTGTSLPQIGNHFGGRDHTTVLHAYEKIKGDREKDSALDKRIIELTELIQKS